MYADERWLAWREAWEEEGWQEVGMDEQMATVRVARGEAGGDDGEDRPGYTPHPRWVRAMIRGGS